MTLQNGLLPGELIKRNIMVTFSINNNY